MFYAITADLLLVVHLGFACFVVAGGLLVCRWRWLALLHLPAVLWAVLLEFRGWICPLTPWEQQLRLAAGQSGYRGSFVEHYLLPVLYPSALDNNTQMILGGFFILVNVVAYCWILLRCTE